MKCGLLENEKHKRQLIFFLTCYLLAQPFIDMLTSFGTRLGYSITVGVIVRSLFMAAVFMYVLLSQKSREKTIGVCYVVAVTIYCAFFVLYFLVHAGLSVTFENIKELIKTFYFSYVLIGFYLVYKNLKYTVPDKILAFIGTTYMAVIFIAFATETSYKSYSGGHGYNGWFYAANEVGAIISILAPVCILYSIDRFIKRSDNKKMKIFFPVISLLLVCFCANFIGTKAVLFGILAYIICALGWSLFRYYFVKKEKENLIRALVCIAMCFVIGVGYFFSPLKKNIDGVLVPGYDQVANQDEDGNQETIENNSGTIVTYKTSAIFNIMNWMLSNRLIMMKPIELTFSERNLLSKCIGLGYETLSTYEFSVDKAVEMDFFAVFYRHGYIGLALFALPIIYMLGIFVWLIIKNIRETLKSFEFCTYLYALFLGIAIAFLAGHTLVAPAVSIYICILMVKLHQERDKIFLLG